MSQNYRSANSLFYSFPTLSISSQLHALLTFTCQISGAARRLHIGSSSANNFFFEFFGLLHMQKEEEPPKGGRPCQKHMHACNVLPEKRETPPDA
jgi:hypothetical protein